MTVQPPPRRPFGVYIHFPWCQRLCPYCDFNTRVTRELPHQAYLQATLRELEQRKHRFEGAQLASIYFGGGTPSLWEPDCIRDLIRAIKDTWPLLNDPEDAALARQTTPCGPPEPLEITLEINPRSANPARLQQLVEAGINRLSVGLQTFDPDYLRRLGRDHTVEQATETLADARDVGIQRLSFDLLTAGPHHTLDALQRDLDAALLLRQADHISAYSLIVEPETPFARLDAKGRLHAADEDTVAAMLDLTHDTLTQGGYTRYEISSYARPGREARHNSLYWIGAEYMGLGVGAHELAFVDKRGSGGGSPPAAGGTQNPLKNIKFL
jgi:oxygen-independent coproporphyrinogen-3 oxidase